MNAERQVPTGQKVQRDVSDPECGRRPWLVFQVAHFQDPVRSESVKRAAHSSDKWRGAQYFKLMPLVKQDGPCSRSI